MKVLTSPSSNTYCVPAALSAITGRHVDEIVTMLREFVGDHPITGIYYPLALAILKKLGYTYRETRPRDDGTFLCTSKSHMFVISQGLFYDNANPTGAQIRGPKITKCFEVFK